jgi:GntR family transcriptional regulator/MocR family aminotransferase
MKHPREEFGPKLQILGAQAGMQLAVMLPKGFRDVEIAHRAAREKLWLWPLSPAYLGKTTRQGFILGFGGTPAMEMSAAVRRLRNIIGSP